MGAQAHQSDPRILNRRTLERDHRHLAHILRPGLSVLDVGCGTGSITGGIARAVGPQGAVVGVDRDGALLDAARQNSQGVSNLRFEEGDALDLGYDAEFDIVSAARVLQWISRPDLAIAEMKKAAKPGGRVVALDYNHEGSFWEPEPPEEFRRFYRAFLDWRSANGWDNRIGDHLPNLFNQAEMADVLVRPADETFRREDTGFLEAASIWTNVIQTLGPRIVSDGFLAEGGLAGAESVYAEWSGRGLRQQTLSMTTVLGSKRVQ